MKIALISTAAVALLIGAGNFLDRNGYERGVENGIAEGRFEMRQHIDMARMANVCLDWADAYDEEKAKQTGAKLAPKGVEIQPGVYAIREDATLFYGELSPTAKETCGKIVEMAKAGASKTDSTEAHWLKVNGFAR